MRCLLDPYRLLPGSKSKKCIFLYFFNITDGTFCHDNSMYVKEDDQTHGSDVYFGNKKARNI